MKWIARNQSFELEHTESRNKVGKFKRFTNNPLLIDHIAAKVEYLTGVTVEQMKGKKSPRVVSEARQMAMALSYDTMQMTEKFIGQYFGNRHPSTVDHARNQVKDFYDVDFNFRNKVDNIREMLKNDKQYKENLDTYQDILKSEEL